MTTQPTTICLINGHPDRENGHYIPALADAYQKGAEAAGHTVRRLNIAEYDLTPMRSPGQFYGDADETFIKEGQQAILDSHHVVLMFPLWLGGVPAYTRAWLEHMARGGFMLEENEDNGWPKANMHGKSLRIVCTMGMPSSAYRLFFGAMGVRSMERGMFGISGFHPIHHNFIGMVEGIGQKGREHWIERMEEFGAKAR